MAKGKKTKKKGKAKGKGTANPDKQRRSHQVEIKQLAIEMKDQKKKNGEIIAEILKRYKKKVSSSTVATWYNEKNRDKIMRLGVDNITSSEVRVNQIQRTRLVIDMEHFLAMYIERQQDKGFSMTTKGIKIQAKLFYNKLIETKIYNNKRECLTELKDLTDKHIEPLLLG